MYMSRWLRCWLILNILFIWTSLDSYWQYGQYIIIEEFIIYSVYVRVGTIICRIWEFFAILWILWRIYCDASFYVFRIVRWNIEKKGISIFFIYCIVLYNLLKNNQCKYIQGTIAWFDFNNKTFSLFLCGVLYEIYIDGWT